jgi:predicted AAA+ superfamily ATPase
VGAELVQFPGEIYYWREKQAEVDFVYKSHGQLYAIEVKSGRKKSTKGLDAFVAKFPQAGRVLITPENFLQFSQERVGFLEKIAV